MILRKVSPSGALQFVGDSHRNFRTTSYGFFGQDSFKLRKNLTLNYGLRYELNTVLHEAHGRLSSFRPQNFTQYLDPSDPTIQSNLDALRASGVVTQSEVGSIYDPDHNNFAPRVGLAWDLFSNGKTVLRAGYGVFYETIIGNIPGNVMLNPPFPTRFLQSLPRMAGRLCALGFSRTDGHTAAPGDTLCAALQLLTAARTAGTHAAGDRLT